MLEMVVCMLLYALFSFPQVFYKFKALLCRHVIDFLLQKHAQHLLSKCLEVQTTSCEHFFQFCRVKPAGTVCVWTKLFTGLTEHPCFFLTACR